MPVGNADVAHLSLLHQCVERAKRLLYRGYRIVAMYLVEVDMIGLQAAQTRLHTVHDMTARRSDVIAPRADAAVDLGGDDDMRARDFEVLQRLTEDLLAFALGVN